MSLGYSLLLDARWWLVNGYRSNIKAYRPPYIMRIDFVNKVNNYRS